VTTNALWDGRLTLNPQRSSTDQAGPRAASGFMSPRLTYLTLLIKR
jgi:hypothetical protein